jgi:hypothetical protein
MLLHGQDCIGGWILHKLHKLHKLMQIYGRELHKRPHHGPDPVGPGHGAANRSILKAERERERDEVHGRVLGAGWLLFTCCPATAAFHPQPPSFMTCISLLFSFLFLFFLVFSSVSCLVLSCISLHYHLPLCCLDLAVFNRSIFSTRIIPAACVPRDAPVAGCVLHSWNLPD